LGGPCSWSLLPPRIRMPRYLFWGIPPMRPLSVRPGWRTSEWLVRASGVKAPSTPEQLPDIGGSLCGCQHEAVVDVSDTRAVLPCRGTAPALLGLRIEAHPGSDKHGQGLRGPASGNGQAVARLKIGLRRATAMLQSARGATGVTYGNGMLTTFRHLPPGSLPPSDPSLMSPVKHPAWRGFWRP
jgi:hypothetical protein